MSTETLIKDTLKRKYPSLDLDTEFQAFIDDEEYDSELIQADIFDPDEHYILKHLISKNATLNKDEFEKTLKDILNNPPNALDQPIKKDNENENENGNGNENDNNSPEIIEFDEDVSDELNNAEEHIVNQPSQTELQPPAMLQSTSTSNISIPSPISSIPQFTQYLFEINTKDKEPVRQLMKQYCMSLSNDENLIYLHMIGYAVEKPFFSWIMDTFDRFKIDYNPHYDNINPLYFGQICPLFDQYLSQLSDKNRKNLSQLSEMDFNSIIPYAMQKYNSNILNGFDFKPKYKISDNYYQFVSNVFGLNNVVKTLVNDKHIYPFQLDVWIIPNKIITNDYQSYEEKKQVDDIEEALLGRDDYGEPSYEDNSYEYENDDDEKKYIFDMNNHKKIIEWIEDSFEGFEEEIKIEKNQRYILMIDRRDNEERLYFLIHNHKDNINDNYSYFNELYFENSKKFVFVTEDENSDENDWSLYENNAHIFGLSYHIMNKDTIKMYWNIGNKKSRFKMNDLYNIWPMYFDDKLNDLQTLDYIQQLTQNSDLCDHEFDAFYQCITKTLNKKDIKIIDKWKINDSDLYNAESMPMEEHKTDNEHNENINQEEINDISKQINDEEEGVLNEEINVENEPMSDISSNDNDNYIENINENDYKNENICENANKNGYDSDEKNIITDHSMSGMIEWLKHQDFVNKYESHHKAFENAILEQWDDSDFEIECLFEELNDIDESEILTTIRDDANCNKSELNNYINQLINNLKQYADLFAKDMDINNINNIDINMKDLKEYMKEDSYEDIDEKVQPNNDYNDEEKFEDIGYKYGGGGNTKILKKVYNKHFSFYCCNDCGGNHFARYIFCDINPTQKLEILMNYFWSFDYELRQNLITLLTNYYDPKQSETMHKLLTELNDSNVFIDIDNKWIDIFKNVLNEENGDILLRLSQLTCVKKNQNLIKELRDNANNANNNIKMDGNILKDLQKSINEIRSNLHKLNINLTNDEITVLYIMANNKNFNILQATHNIDGKRRSCQWKCFHFNLISAVDKLKKHRYHFDIPNDLYCNAHGINEMNHLNLYLNQITLWIDKNDSMVDGNNSILHLKNLKMKAQQNIQNNIQIIPINFIVNKNGDHKLFLVLPLRITKLSCISKRHVSDKIWQYTIPPKSNYKSIEIITL